MTHLPRVNVIEFTHGGNTIILTDTGRNREHVLALVDGTSFHSSYCGDYEDRILIPHNDGSSVKFLHSRVARDKHEAEEAASPQATKADLVADLSVATAKIKELEHQLTLRGSPFPSADMAEAAE